MLFSFCILTAFFFEGATPERLRPQGYLPQITTNVQRWDIWPIAKKMAV
jgi:hypothetical protein